jgi:hypothetical protein
VSSLLEPAQYITVPGGTVVLPPNARPDLAFTVTQQVPGAATFVVFWQASSSYYDIVTSLSFTFSTDGGAGDRLLKVSYGTTAAPMSGPVQAAGATQPASTVGQYVFTTGITAGTTNTTIANAQVFMVPLPLFVVTNTQTVAVTIVNEGGSDSLTVGSVTVVRVPTGPSLANEQPAAASTPPPLLPTPIVV